MKHKKNSITQHNNNGNTKYKCTRVKSEESNSKSKK